MDDGILVLSFEGSQTIEKAEEIKKSLSNAIRSKKKEIIINLSKVEKIDLSFLQLLFSATTEAESKKKKISINEDVPNEILDVIDLCGFNRKIGENPYSLFSGIKKS